ncbi:MAG: type II toxin-antitoxin system HipA family toxin [Epsilonproteobacteria bacterium]|nr:type II toxin-antitoxin system HipA family toxin [Campylobacterota bacterium]
MISSVNLVTVFLNLGSKKHKVGRLAYKNRNIYFEYEASFLKMGLELSPYKLPLQEGVFTCEERHFDGLWGLFNDSLPDGWGRLLMDRHLARLGVNHKNITALQRFVYVGNYAMGALSYEPEYEHNEKQIGEIVLDELAVSSQEILEGSSDYMVDELLALGGSSGGARPKALIQLNEKTSEIIHGLQTLKKGYSHWMVKFASSLDTQEIGKVEYAYSLMAREAKIEMPKTTLLRGKKGSYFACERFDRKQDERFHMHSLAGLVHSDFRYPSLDYDDLLSLTLHLTKNVKEQEKVFRLACFNLFSHNRDDHDKNFSFIMNAKGVWFFSPVYDITFSSGPGGEHSLTYMGEGKKPTKKHLLALAKKHHIKNADVIINQVIAAVKKWKHFAQEVGVSKNLTASIEKALKPQL